MLVDEKESFREELGSGSFEGLRGASRGEGRRGRSSVSVRKECEFECLGEVQRESPLT